MNIDLSGRTAMVTGSTAGIGEATAQALATAGAGVVINGRDDERVMETAKRLAGIGVTADVSTPEGAAAAISQVPDIDILVNNTGTFATQPVFEIPDEEWIRFFQVNVLSGVRLARHYTPRMSRRGWGRVIFVSSEAGIQTPTNMVHYGMTKTAQLAVSRGMAQEVAGSGVTVNCVLPGPTLSAGVLAMWDDLYPGARHRRAGTQVRRRRAGRELLVGTSDPSGRSGSPDHLPCV
jgi:NAD(P)-dependent dehydrogenase (short-subunit alcohol dehydrogenase family)